MCLEIRGQRFEKSFVKSRICVCLYLIHFHTVQMWLQQLKTFTEQEKKSWWKDCYWNGSLRNENSVIVHSLQTCETFFCGTLQKISEVREVQCWTKTVIEISSFAFHDTNDQPYLHSPYATFTETTASEHTPYWTQGACQAESGRYFCCTQYSEWIQLNWTPSHGTQTLNAFSRGPNSTECSPFTLRKYNQTAVNQVGGRWERQRGVKSDCLRRAKLLGCADWRI